MKIGTIAIQKIFIHTYILEKIIEERDICFSGGLSGQKTVAKKKIIDKVTSCCIFTDMHLKLL